MKEVIIESSSVKDNKLKLESLNFQKELIKEELEFDVLSKAVKDKIPPPIPSSSASEAVAAAASKVTKKDTHHADAIKLTPQIAEALEVLASKSALAAEVSHLYIFL